MTTVTGNCPHCGKPLNTQTGGCNWCPLLQEVRPIRWFIGGSYAGVQHVKEFKTREHRARWMLRMVDIYGERFYMHGDKDGLRFYHSVNGEWV